MSDRDDLRYPVGRFSRPTAPLGAEARADFIREIAELPSGLRAAVEALDDTDLDTPYRPGGWTVRQVVHHVPDSHMNAYIRMKLAATEDSPTIKTYDEARWAELPEARTGPIGVSLALLDALHVRWTAFLRALPPADFARCYVHAELGPMSMDAAVALYAWHGRHHLAHVLSARGASSFTSTRT